MPRRMLRLGGIQMPIHPHRPEENLERAERALRIARSTGCQLVAFPELFLTGPLGRAGLSLAQPIPGPWTEELGRLARTHGLYVAMGTIVERASPNGPFYNTAVLLDDRGHIVGTYRKRKLWNGEKAYIAPGGVSPVFETELGRVGLAVCWDLAFPEVIKELALQGAQIVVCPSFWLWSDRFGMLPAEERSKVPPGLDTEGLLVDTCVAARAVENALAFLYVNGTGPYPEEGANDELLGRTQLTVPLRGRVAFLERGEGLVVGEVDLEELELAERIYELRKDSEILQAQALERRKEAEG